MRSLAEIVSLRTAECRLAAAAIPALAAGETSLAGFPFDPAAHASQCLRCQAELSAYRRMLGQLHGLRDLRVTPPEGALASLLEAISADPPQPTASWVVRAAYVGGITVATAAAGAAGVLVWMNRRRPGLASAS